MLAGARGRKAVNISALVNIIVKVSKMAMANKKIAELDFNPVIIDERTAVVADARIMHES